ncbi:MAG: D-aminoacyl-tRNA deacylase [Granulosicoccus sp.]
MISLIQRVTEASVRVDTELIARIGPGLLALIGVEKHDNEFSARQLADRVLGYRIFPDSAGRMNLDLCAAGGQILLVPQFTLVADTSKGRRPGFSMAAPPDQAATLFAEFVAVVGEHMDAVQQGRFGADMKVGLVNDGPVTFWLRAEPDAKTYAASVQ